MSVSSYVWFHETLALDSLRRESAYHWKTWSMGRHTSAVWKPSADNSLKQQGSNLNSLGCAGPLIIGRKMRRCHHTCLSSFSSRLLRPSQNCFFHWMMLQQWIHGINQWRHLLRRQNALLAKSLRSLMSMGHSVVAEANMMKRRGAICGYISDEISGASEGLIQKLYIQKICACKPQWLLIEQKASVFACNH